MPDGYSVVLHFRTDDQQAEELEALSKSMDRPKGWIVRRALAEYLGRHYVTQVTGNNSANVSGLVQCHVCGNYHSDMAAFCPHCTGQDGQEL